jgi:hypothetical protein
MYIHRHMKDDVGPKSTRICVVPCESEKCTLAKPVVTCKVGLMDIATRLTCVIIIC